jgi:hypothetical protein
MEIDVRNLHPLEIRLLRHVSPEEEVTARRLIDELDYKIGQCNQAFSWLVAKGFLEETGRKAYTLYELTDLVGNSWIRGLPHSGSSIFSRPTVPLRCLSWHSNWTWTSRMSDLLSACSPRAEHAAWERATRPRPSRMRLPGR